MNIEIKAQPKKYFIIKEVLPELQKNGSFNELTIFQLS